MADVIDRAKELEDRIDSAKKALVRMQLVEQVGGKAYFCWTCQTTTDWNNCYCDWQSDWYD